MDSSTPLRRTRMKRKPRRRVTSEAAREYMLFVRGLLCLCPDLGCDGENIEAHHAGRRGMGTKASDFSCVPLARNCHRGFHSATGSFLNYTQAQRREWAAWAIGVTQSNWISHHCGQVKPWENAA